MPVKRKIKRGKEPLKRLGIRRNGLKRETHEVNMKERENQLCGQCCSRSYLEQTSSLAAVNSLA